MSSSSQKPIVVNRRRLSLSFFGSIATHASLVLFLFLLLHHREHTAYAGGGEDGVSGSGDTAIDVSLAAPEPASTAATVDPSPVPEEKSEDPTGEAPMTTPAPRPTSTSNSKKLPPLPANGKDDTTNGGKRPTPIGAGVGNGIDGNSIDGQRALLPQKAVCDDPVAGKWEALKFAPARGDWVHFVLRVKREGSSLTGQILSHTWSGGPRDLVPATCNAGDFDFTVSMPASGATNGRSVAFGASRYTLLTAPCARIFIDYAPDHFSGVIDPDRQEFQSVNNDGANDVDAPYVFRRTACLDP